MQCTFNLLSRMWSIRAFKLTRSLHWLSVKEQICYKIGLLGFKAIHLLLPPYLLKLLSDYQPGIQFRSSSAFLFSKPAVALYFALHTFSTAVPSVWNSLEPDFQSAASLTFKFHLKTALFSATCT